MRKIVNYNIATRATEKNPEVDTFVSHDNSFVKSEMTLENYQATIEKEQDFEIEFHFIKGEKEIDINFDLDRMTAREYLTTIKKPINKVVIDIVSLGEYENKTEAMKKAKRIWTLYLD